PGVYARSLMEGRLPQERLLNFRREVDGKGVSSYPHPWLMPDYWQFPTVSMGLGPIQAIYMARYLKYLEARGLAQTANRKVWVFCGDGEMDEPETLGCIGLAAREKLDNLIFVINCNLQRLDGPVRGNGKIIQELEGTFRGAGWNVVKCIWGSDWDELLARDTTGALARRMMEVPDGEYQEYAYAAKKGKPELIREKFFNSPELKALVADKTDDLELKQAQELKGLRSFRDRFALPLSDADLKKYKFYRPGDDAPEMRYLFERRKALGGFQPARNTAFVPCEPPKPESFARVLQ